MPSFLKTVFLLGCLTLISACSTVYTGEVTDMAASEERQMVAADGQGVSVVVDVFARDTTKKKSGHEPLHLGTRYVSQITYTFEDGTQKRESVPAGDFKERGNSVGFTSERGSGSKTVEHALEQAWIQVGQRLSGHLPFSSIYPAASADAMLGAVDAVTN